MSGITVHFENLRFTEAPKEQMLPNEGGICFLGYQQGDLIVPGVLPGGEDLKVTLKDIRVRVSALGEYQISAPSREYEIRGQKRRSAFYWVDGPTLDYLIKQIFSQRVVQRACEIALAQVDADKV